MYLFYWLEIQDGFQIKKKLADTTGVIRSHKSMKNKQYNGQRKRTNNDLQNTTQKAKDWVTLTPLKTEGECGSFGKVSRSCSTCDIRHVTVRQHEHHLIWKSRTYQGWTLGLEASKVALNNLSLYKVSDTSSYQPLIFLILFQV